MMESLTDCPTEELAAPAPTHAAQHPASHNDIDTACAQACQAIAPAWPLDRAIAVNPHWARIGMPVRRVAAVSYTHLTLPTKA